MGKPALKTIDDYRDKFRRSCVFHEIHELSPTWAISELAEIVLESLAVTGSPHLFDEADEAVRRIVLRDLRHYKRTGQRQLIHPHAGTCTDGRAVADAAIATLVSAGLVSQSMQCVAVPYPMFTGLESIRGVDPLLERLLCDDTLLDVELVALGQDVSKPRAHSQCWTLSLLITEHERVNVDERTYRRVPFRSLVATFAMRGNVSIDFWPRFSFGHVSRFRVSHASRLRGPEALQIKLDLHGKGRLYCREMELLRIEEVGCTDEENAQRL